MSTWKKYGGIDKFDKTNHMTVDTMVTNYFTVRKQIIGDVDISGNLAVRTRLDVYDDASFNKDMTVSGSVDIGGILDVSGNITTNSNLTVKKDILVYNNLYFNPDRKVFMNGTPDGIGVNTNKPISQFDITSDLESVFSVKTSQSNTENVIARNNTDKGIVVKSDLSSATIDFFCDSSMVSSTFPFLDASGLPQLDVQLNYNNYDARIQAKNDGSLTIDASASIQLLSQTIITENTSSILDNNASLSVYNDKTTNVYLEDVYDNSASYVSDGISLVSVDESSSIFMKMLSRNEDATSKGFALVGGAFPGDTSRAMGSLGCLDSSGNYIPNQTIVSGNSNVKLKTTVGINKYVPSADIQVLDINGPARINNGEITTVQNIDFQCNFVCFCRDNVNYGISTGESYSIFSDTSYADAKYWESKIYYTSDAGITWNNASVKVYGTTNAKSLNTGFVYDSSYAFVYGDDGTGFYTNNGGASWLNKSFNATSTDVQSLYIAKNVGNADCRFFMTYDGVGLRYYDAKIGSTNGSYVSYDSSAGSIVLTNSGGYTINSLDISGGVNVVHGYGTKIYCAGSYIYKYGATSTITTGNYESIHIPSDTGTYSYNTIYVYDNSYAVAAGVNIISYTLNGGALWNDITFTTDTNDIVDGVNSFYTENGESFQSIHVYDSSNAIVVGTYSSMYYTNNGTLWKKVPDNLLDAAGNRSICYGSSNVLLNGVYCIDKNSFITTRIVENYVDTTANGSSKIFYNYFPNLFNRNENVVLDMCGNMNIFGDINIQDNGNINSNGTTFYLVNENVQDIHFGGDASAIEIGYTSGSTTIRHNLYVDKDLTVVDGDLYVPNTAYINLADISGLQVYEDASIDGILTVGTRVVIENDASITADDTSGAPLYVAGGSHFAGNVIMSNSDSLLYVNGDTQLIGNLYAMNNVYLESTNTTDDYTVQIMNGNVFLNNSMDISGNLEINGNLSIDNSTYLNGTTYINGNIVYGENVVISINDPIISGVTFTAATFGLGNVDNTSDLDKPISTATRTYVDASLNNKAPINSPTFTGTPVAPTPNTNDNSTQIATTAFVNNQNYLKTTSASSVYAPIYSPDLSGIPTAPTVSTDVSSSQIATTAFVKNVVANIPIYTDIDNTWSGNNSFSNDIYVHGTRFGTMDGSSIVIGNNSLTSLSTGTNNIAIGSYTGYNITTGSTNTMMGYQSLYNNKIGGNNVAMGASALYNNNEGSYNIAIGDKAGYSDTSGSYNTYLGVNTDTSGNYTYSTAIGYGATITTNNEIVLGTRYEYVSVPSTTSSTSINTGALVVKGGMGIAGNIFLNRNIDITANATIRGNVRSTSTSTGALIVSTGGAGIAGNVHIGSNAYIYGNIYTPTASSSEDSSMVATTSFVKTAITNDQATNHSWTGTNSFSQNITVNNSVVGKYATNNYVFGNSIMPSIENAENNIGIGNNVLYSNYTGSNNIAIGNNSMYDLYDNENNTALGHYALSDTGGNNNTAIGYYAGINNYTGINNTFIGANTSSSTGEYSYSTAIGYGATITASNEIVLGTTDEYVYIPGTAASTSSTNGALVVSGGIGVAGNVYVGGVLYLENDIDPSDNSTQLATTSYVQSALSGTSFDTGGNYTWTGTNEFSQNITVNDMVVGNYSNNYSLGMTFGNITSGFFNIGIGKYGMSKITNGSNNIGIGPYAFYNNVSGSNNIGIGSNTLASITTANSNVAVGYESLANSTGISNTAIGFNSGYLNTTGEYNSFLGYRAKTSGTYSYSTAIGQYANITANNQVVLGTSTEYIYIPGTKVSTSSTTGALVVSGGAGIAGNVYVGGNIYLSNTISTSDNSNMVATTAFVQSLVTSSGSTSTSSNNTWTGTNAFSQNITVKNMIIGNYGTSNYSLGTTFENITSGSFNIGIGPYIMPSNTSGLNNIGIGSTSLYRNVSGSQNIAIGVTSLFSNTTSEYNVAVGHESLVNTVNNYNTAIGSKSGNNNTSGQYNSFLGYFTKNSGTYSYSTAIGQNANITANNQVVLGTSTEYIYIPGTKVSTSSTTGALVVSGGAGIAGNVYVGGNIYLSNTISTSDNSNMVATTAFVQSLVTSSGSTSTSSNNTWTGTNAFSQNITVKDMVIGNYSSNYSLGTIFGNSITGTSNIGVGPYGMTKITTGTNNIGIGASTIIFNATGSNNIGIGFSTLSGNANINENTAIGSYSLQLNTSNYNTAVGYYSGNNNTSGQYNSFLGYGTKTSGTYSYSTAIGQNANITANNQVVLGTSTEYVSIPGTTVSTSTTSGALVVSGGAGIVGNVYVGGNISVAGNVITATKITNSTASTSTITGALVVSGGAGISGDVYVGGNVNVSGILYATTANSTDNSTRVATTAYVQTAISGISGSSGSSSVSLSTTNTWTSVNTFSNTTASTTTSSGALVVSGGVGISGNVYVGGNISVDANVISTTKITNTTASTSTSSGALVVSGGAGIAGNVYVGGNVSIVANVSITGNIITATKITNTTASTSTTSGALVVSGGAGIAGNVYVGGNLYTSGSINVNYTSLPTLSESSIGGAKTYTQTSTTITLSTSYSTVCTIDSLPAGIWHISIAFQIDPGASTCLNSFSLGTSTTNDQVYRRYSIYMDGTDTRYQKMTDVIQQSSSSTNWYLIGKSTQTDQKISQIYIVCFRIA